MGAASGDDTCRGAKSAGRPAKAIAQASGIRNPNHVRAGQLVYVR
ncbi:MAG: hypothetical protein NZ528_02080 [Caldilineales bacterium]|nr:hypothetical protein [Caldilineales bacterium]MDW8317082.1 hypothetical protein [Anaerolineae bacterium]